MEIAAGSVVKLKSGGMAMTVKWVEHGEAYCEWMNDKGDLQEKKFTLTSLELTEAIKPAIATGGRPRGVRSRHAM